MPVFRRTRRKSASEIEHRIRSALEEIHPLLGVDSFAVELLRFDSETGTAHLRVTGDCPDCQMTAATFTRGIEAHLRRSVPEITAVESDSRG